MVKRSNCRGSGTGTTLTGTDTHVQLGSGIGTK